jgi:phosphonate transport system permease protein
VSSFPAGRRWRRRERRLVALVLLAGFGASALTAVAGPVLNMGGWPLVARFFEGALEPRLDARFLALTLDAALTTVAYAALGTFLAVAIGLVGGVLSSQLWWRPDARSPRSGLALWGVARGVLALPRGVHEVVWALFLLSVLGIDPLVAVLAIGLPFGAITAKVFSEMIDESPRAPFIALRAAGADRVEALAYGVLPAAAGDMLSYSFYRFECAIRAAAILGMIGAGGLGFQLALSFQSLNYDEMWTLIYALVLICAAGDLWSWVVRRRHAGVRVSSPIDCSRATKTAGESRRHRRDRVLTASVGAGLVLVPVSAWWIGLSPSQLASERTRRLLAEVLTGAWPPDLPSNLGSLASASLDTLAMASLAAGLSFAGAAALAFPAAWPHLSHGGGWTRRWARVAGVALTRGALLLMRAIPPPVWALLFLFVLSPGVLPGALALAAYNLGVLGRLLAEVVENLDDRPVQALRDTGASSAHVFLYGTVPQAASRFAAYGMYRWEVVMRDTVVVGVVGAGGLGVLLKEQLVRFDYSAVFTTLAVLIALTLAVDLVSALVRRTVR